MDALKIFFLKLHVALTMLKNHNAGYHMVAM